MIKCTRCEGWGFLPKIKNTNARGRGLCPACHGSGLLDAQPAYVTDDGQIVTPSPSCVDALAESITWQLAKDSGLNESTCDTRDIAARAAALFFEESMDA